ncbi:class I lanthipeptide [Cruoricaptor ignavus]|uniref:Class I lanthipeptide n=1 Tax=Cruoricaptor ignavus TaxID=1118202 RepID=A0A7M1T387_9FLAO|nr:class I lanthipeptide [Cruoricaptor ignavus]QOR73747.1 class I lanthipeptide [Cruoricaptor ignavus]
MKKLELDPLSLDKETIALLDEKQLQEIVGGQAVAPGTSTGCGSGASTCGTGGGSTGCGSGGSTCISEVETSN